MKTFNSFNLVAENTSKILLSRSVFQENSELLINDDHIMLRMIGRTSFFDMNKAICYFRSYVNHSHDVNTNDSKHGLCFPTLLKLDIGRVYM